MGTAAAEEVLGCFGQYGVSCSILDEKCIVRIKIACSWTTVPKSSSSSLPTSCSIFGPSCLHPSD